MLLMSFTVKTHALPHKQHLSVVYDVKCEFFLLYNFKQTQASRYVPIVMKQEMLITMKHFGRAELMICGLPFRLAALSNFNLTSTITINLHLQFFAKLVLLRTIRSYDRRRQHIFECKLVLNSYS